MSTPVSVPTRRASKLSCDRAKGSAANCSRCHLPAPGYDQLAERRLEFISLWRSFVFLLYACVASIAAGVAWWPSKKSPGPTANPS